MLLVMEQDGKDLSLLIILNGKYNIQASEEPNLPSNSQSNRFPPIGIFAASIRNK